ncbi:HipA N-terminal domain-containing protein [Labilibaculum euxinus]|uniref:Phosphatidylinositol kinase n=1 Tax=Labilibaculum euxinus TaxID=2686357 RepID=A0A7M4DB28_9BACT|nr:HipA N-terminal domain-containing protein [Labilibaculum euxinus]MUP39857.1 phosphatidylinositol kinase [Labilibaculum euxinus]MVB09062.1 phosphatidylinositol kinase [Labilibaculum euxinus]
MRKANVYMNDQLAGTIVENEEGYLFVYDKGYLESESPEAISLTLPLSDKPYSSATMFPFFDGLIPEGWLLDIAEKNWKLRESDRMGLLMACCRDCIGAVSVIAED